MDAAAAAVLSRLDGIFTLKEEQRTTFRGFLYERKHILAIVLTDFDETLVKQSPQGAGASSMSPPRTNKKPRPVAN